MKILSCDQSTRFTGVSVKENGQLLHYELIDTSKIPIMLERFKVIKKRLKRLIYVWQPNIVVLEDVQSQLNPKTFKELSKLLGILELFLDEYKENLRKTPKYQVYIISPSKWRSILKFPRMKRQELKKYAIQYIKDLYGITVKDDIAEAICIGLAIEKIINGEV